MKKIYIAVILFLFFFLIIGTFLISQDHNNKFSKLIKDNFPQSIKIFLKEKIFFIPLKLREVETLRSKLSEVMKENSKLYFENRILKNNVQKGKFETKIISKYKMESFVLPISFNKEPDENYKDFNVENLSGYLDNFEDKIVIAFSKGKIGFLNKSNFFSYKLDFKLIKSNLKDIIKFENDIVWTGIKDIKIVNNKIYLSVTEEIKNNCYNTSLISANLSLSELNFAKIFSSNECASIEKRIKYFKYFNGHQTGGRIEFKENKLYLTVGDYNQWEFPQDINSVFGKIVEIDLNDKSYKFISTGHRNPQGLKFTSISTEDNILISTEHGPKGGDEINLINLSLNLKKNNFGWPIASYGNHYDLIPINNYSKKYAPLKKNHSKNGFIEPIYYFEKSIGISEIIKNNFSEKNQFFATSLKNQKIYILEYINQKKLNLINEIFIGERIRDIIYDTNENAYYLYLEGTPKIQKITLN